MATLELLSYAAPQWLYIQAFTMFTLVNNHLLAFLRYMEIHCKFYNTLRERGAEDYFVGYNLQPDH